MMPKDHFAREWLSNQAIPLWSDKGVDWENQGGFFESLSLQGEPLTGSKRAMVQARQVYSFRLAAELGCCETGLAHRAVENGARHLLKQYSLPSGAFIHSVTADGSPEDQSVDLYAQAFALFGLAHAYAIRPDESVRQRAFALLRYLDSERRLSKGGFSEFQGRDVIYEANPHMHLFEAALAWMEVDSDPKWRALADELMELCRRRLIDSSTGLLCEHFTESWAPIRDAGRFVFEPGHQYEWAWLIGRYEAATGQDFFGLRQKLYELSEKHGICPKRRAVYDEVWSDLTPRTRSARFWPQCERIKAAVQLSARNPSASGAADEALRVLFRYFGTSVQGLWFDRWDESLQFVQQPAKASSLYHIIGALSEYLRWKEGKKL